MWTQTWPPAELRQIDRETRKIITENVAPYKLECSALSAKKYGRKRPPTGGAGIQADQDQGSFEGL